RRRPVRRAPGRRAGAAAPDQRVRAHRCVRGARRLHPHRQRWPRAAERGHRARAAGDRRGGHRRHEHHRRPRHRPRHAARGAAGGHRVQRRHPAVLAVRAHPAVHRPVHPRGGRRRPAARAAEERAMTEIETVPPAERTRGEGIAARVLRIALTERIVLLAVLLVVVVVWFRVLGAGGYLVAPYDLRYLGNALELMVPFALLAIAELFVIVSGRGGIDLSVGAIVSLAGMVFGFMVGVWEWPLLPSIVGCIVVGALLGA